MTQGDQDVIKDFLSISKYIILGKNKKSKKKGLKKLESIVKKEKFYKLEEGYDEDEWKDFQILDLLYTWCR